MKKLLIAIDGPAGSGKSTTARLVARKLGYIYVDTGAMYRAMTLKVLRSNLDPADEINVVKAAKESRLSLRKDNGGLAVLLDGEDVTELTRSEAVTENVSLVSSYPELRQIMVEKQREIGAGRACVVDGRDIGTVVFPDADLKFFVTADIMERARRRRAEISGNGRLPAIEQVVDELRARDSKDSSRQTSPLKKAEDAIEIDTTNMTIDEQVEEVLTRVNEVLMEQEEPVRK